jgi:hypothetical protein
MEIEFKVITLAVELRSYSNIKRYKQYEKLDVVILGGDGVIVPAGTLRLP